MTERVRVQMIWPKDLKERVAARVGSRGTTEFTIRAVEDALLELSKPKSQRKPRPDPKPAPPKPTNLDDIDVDF